MDLDHHAIILTITINIFAHFVKVARRSKLVLLIACQAGTFLPSILCHMFLHHTCHPCVLNKKLIIQNMIKIGVLYYKKKESIDINLEFGSRHTRISENTDQVELNLGQLTHPNQWSRFEPGDYGP